HCVDRRIPILEIIPAKGSRPLKNMVHRYLQQLAVHGLHHRIDKDSPTEFHPGFGGCSSASSSKPFCGPDNTISR
ncbi:MAG: hypothetical protein KBH07_13080, partial [Flavobacteriales bacterium]|nr:hypothetical protein [Flavobacteriales bacterium]